MIYLHSFSGYIFIDLFISLIREIFKAEPTMIRAYFYICFWTACRFLFSGNIRASYLLNVSPLPVPYAALRQNIFMLYQPLCLMSLLIKVPQVFKCRSRSTWVPSAWVSKCLLSTQVPKCLSVQASKCLEYGLLNSLIEFF